MKMLPKLPFWPLLSLLLPLLLPLLLVGGPLAAAPVVALPVHSARPAARPLVPLAALMGRTWRVVAAALVLDGAVGTRAAAPDTYRFEPGGRLLITPADGEADTLRWALGRRGTRLTLGRAGGPTRTLRVFGLGTTSLSFGDDFDHRALRADLRRGVRPSLVQLLLRSAGDYAFAAGSPPPKPAVRLRRLQYRLQLLPQPALAAR